MNSLEAACLMSGWGQLAQTGHIVPSKTVDGGLAPFEKHLIHFCL